MKETKRKMSSVKYSAEINQEKDITKLILLELAKEFYMTANLTLFLSDDFMCRVPFSRIQCRQHERNFLM